MLGRKWVLRTPFEGVAKLSDFKLVEELIVADSLQNGEILCRALWLSVDPYMRVAGGSQDTLLEGGVLPGSQVAIVEKSNHKEYPVGTLVLGYFGWRDLTLFQPDLVSRPMYFYKLPDLKGLSPSYFLGAVGMPGNTALFGLEKVLGVKEGSTVVISSAAGAVGGIACQIAKMKGCKVLSFTGSFEKTVWLKEIGAGYIFDYTITDVDKVIKEFAPEGVDFFFDNVGGDFSSKVMRNMKQNGKIALCGAISQYNQQTNGHSQPKIPFDYKSFIYKKLKMEGFLVSEWESEWQESLMRLRDWVVQGKLQVQETITNGFDKMPEAFLNLFEGKNIGKMVVKV